MTEKIVVGAVQNPSKKGTPSSPKRKNLIANQRSFSCSFQRQEHLYSGESKEKSKPKKADVKSTFFPALVKDVIYRPRILLGNARRTIAWRRRIEQPWMKGSEMHQFYNIWEHTSQQTVKSKLPKLAHRSDSLPRNFKFPGELSLNDSHKERKTQHDFGIIRDCCCSPKVRIKY